MDIRHLVCEGLCNPTLASHTEVVALHDPERRDPAVIAEIARETRRLGHFPHQLIGAQAHGDLAIYRIYQCLRCGKARVFGCESLNKIEDD